MNAARPPVIAIDGPSGSGKGTIASRAADVLGWNLLDSGALYRILAYVAQQAGVSADATAQLEELAGGLRVAFTRTSAGAEQILLDGRDVTAVVRSEESGKRASELAVIPQVRRGLAGVQRGFRRAPGLVADGRDMGTVVFPDAELKVFLTASPEIRAERRYKQLIEKGIDANLRALSRDLRDRDERDAKRAVAPLVPAPDSQVLDSSALSIDEVAECIVGWWRERAKGGRGSS